MKKTAIAPANIAFIKYWGKRDENLRLPSSSSISMNLDKCFTQTTVEFSKQYEKDSFSLAGEVVSEKEVNRVFRNLDRIRHLGKTSLRAKVVSQNSFPKSGGIASSASGFAALTVAAASALNLKITEKELTILARLASGSACRSIPDGFVLWQEGKTSKESFAYSLFKEDYWDLRDILVIVTTEQKKIATTAGHTLGETSIFYQQRINEVKTLIEESLAAFSTKDFSALGEIMEKDCLYMHSIMMTSNPPLFYWYPKTVELIRLAYFLRSQKIKVYFTIDAGPNVHLICQGKDEKKVISAVKKISSLVNIISNKPAKGARLSNNHLF